jgi:hypothetical protein
MNSQQIGVFQRVAVALFGERTRRLRESTSSAHWLSYLLVTVQSAAVVLALGHQQLQLLLSGDPAITLIAGLALFLLVSTVIAADLCLLATLQRVPVLARNRATWALVEHMAYLAFVLLVEGSTLALVLAVLDTDPRALVSDAPVIPAGGWMFAAQIGARAALTCWTAVQLWIVRAKLPPQWSTLLLEARELLGGKAQQVMGSLNLDRAPLASLFDAYSQMSRPPARVARWWNRGLIRREAAALAEEDRQREAVVRALATFDAGALSRSAMSDAQQPSTRPPTGPGSPVLAPSPAPLDNTAGGERDRGSHTSAKQRREAVIRLVDPDAPARRRAAATGRANGGSAKGVRTPRDTRANGRSRPGVKTPTDPDAVERAARAAWAAGARTVGQLESQANISRAAASKHRRILMAESGQTMEGKAAQ